MELYLKRVLLGKQVHYADPEQLMASEKGKVLRSDDQGQSWEVVWHIAQNRWEAGLLTFSLYRRGLRKGVHNILCLPTGEYLIVSRRRLNILDAQGAVRPLPFFGNGSRPLREAIFYHKGNVFYGEYWANPDRVPVSLIEVSFGHVQKIYQFPAGKIRHIHAVQYDPYTEQYWIATGDQDHECLIGLFKNDFRTLEIIGSGSQTWRTVCLAFTREYVFWGTDDPEGENRVIRYDRKTGEKNPVFMVDGPVYYNRRVGDYLIFATTVEDKRHSDGVGRLYLYDLRAKAHTIGLELEKDNLPARLLGYGVFEFARGNLDGNQFWVTAKGFEGGLRSCLFEVARD
jgi:hypothetical protein